MRFFNAHVRSALLACWIMAACACSSHHPVAQKAPAQPPTIQKTSAPAAASSQPAPGAMTTPDKDAPPQTSAAAPPEPPAADRVGDLVAQAEEQYQRGVANYQAGNTDQARQDFDHALNSLLESNLDIRSDNQIGR